MIKTTEIWKDIPGYEGSYQVSDQGRVKSLSRKSTQGHKLKEKILLPSLNKGGYFHVSLCHEGIKATLKVHKLVLEAFIGPKPKGMETCHNDGDKTNNRLENLRWDTHSNNQLDSVKHGTHYIPTPIRRPVVCIETGQVFASLKEAAKFICGHMSPISKVCRGKQKTHCGLTWSYINEIDN